MTKKKIPQDPHKDINMNEIERIRQSFKPGNINVLLVGESAPVSGDFFYKGNSDLTTHTRTAFEDAFQKDFKDNNKFLSYFKKHGYYFDDLVLEPINQLEDKEKKKISGKSIEPLSERIKEYNPKVVIACLKKIDDYIQRAIIHSKIHCRFYAVPFAGYGHQNSYVKQLTVILKNINTTT